MKQLRSLSSKLLLALLLLSGTSEAQTKWSTYPVNFDANVYGMYADTAAHALYVTGQYLKNNSPVTRIIRINEDESIDTLPSIAVQYVEFCLIRWNSKLYLGGDALYVLENGAWQLLDGVPNKVLVGCFYPYKGKLLMAGLFQDGSFPTIAGQTTLVEYDGSTFSRFNGADSVIHDGGILSKITEYKGDLIVSGNFDPYPPIDPRYKEIARWTGTKWMPLGNGIPGNGQEEVTDMAVHNGELYVSGDFRTNTGGPGNGIARWNGTSWSPIGDGTKSPTGVEAIAFQGDTLNMVGNFQLINGHRSPVFARYYNGQWCYNPDSMIGAATCIAELSGKMIMGGAFSVIGATPDQPLAKFLGDDCFKTTGVEAPVTPPDFVLYPNPAPDMLSIRWTSRPADAVIYRVTDPLGRCITKLTSQEAHVSIDARQWPGGVYWLDAQSGARHTRRSFLKL